MRCQIHWKRDLAALTITSAFFALLLIATAGSPGGLPAESGPALQLGTPNQVAIARSVLDPAGAREEEDAFDSADEPNESGAEAAAERAAEREEPSGADPAAESPDTSPHRQPVPTEVERAPKKVESMSPSEIRQTVEQYRRWFHEGQYELTLDHARLSAEDLSELTAFWVLTSGTGNRLRVDRWGGAWSCQDVPEGMLIGDLNDEKWPASLHEAARARFGRGYQATAQFALVDHAALLLYRALAQEIGRHDPQPGTEFVLRIDRENGRLKTELVAKRYRAPATSKQERSMP